MIAIIMLFKHYLSSLSHLDTDGIIQQSIQFAYMLGLGTGSSRSTTWTSSIAKRDLKMK